MTTRPILPSGRRPYLPAAPYYDGRTKDTKLDQYGVHRGIHPADSGMAMSLMVKKGSNKAAPNQGHTLAEIRDLKAADLAEQIRTRVEAAEPLARLVSERKVNITKIDHWAARGKLAVVVHYLNIATGERQTADWYS